MSNPCDPDFDDVGVLFNCDGTNGSTTFTDLSNNALPLTPHATGANVSTTNPKFGTGCFNGTGDTYIDTPIDAAGPIDLDGDFTLEGWARWDSLLFGSSVVMQIGDTVGGAQALFFGHNSSGACYLSIPGSAWSGTTTPNGTVTAGPWFHFAVCRQGNNGYLFVDGVGAPVQPTDWTGTPTWGAKASFGGTYTGSGIGVIGATDEFRITKGVARYTSDFTPPTQAFPTFDCTAACDPDFADVSILLPCDGVNGSPSFPDQSDNALVVTPNALGPVEVTTTDPKFGTGCMKIGTAFPGVSGARVPAPNDGPLDLPQGGDFTIEFWARFTAQNFVGAILSWTNVGSTVFTFVISNTNGGININTNVAGWSNVSNGNLVADGVWCHIAIVRDGTDGHVYLDGVETPASEANDWTGTPHLEEVLTIGSDSSIFLGMIGAIDELRITKGIARYTANFTPPTQAFPNHECTVPQVEVPDVVGESLADATTDIEAVPLAVGAVTYDFSDTVPAGDVISSNPAAGATVDEGSDVDLVVSLGPSATVPDVVGLSQDDATTAIVGASLVVGDITSAYSESVPEGLIISQDPASGSEVAPGAEVDFVLSLGAPPVSVPNVVTYLFDAAASILAGVGLTVGAVSQTFSEDIEFGAVVSQSPAAGAMVGIGTPIDLVTSLGPAVVSVPDVLGLSASDASDVLRGAGLRVGIITVDTSGTFPIGTIAAEEPNAGALVPGGTKINLVLSSIAPPFDVDATVISQYQQSPTLVEMVEDFAVYIDPRTNLTLFYSLVWNVDTAQGFGLDVWGKIVGVSRLLRIVADDPMFGFDNESDPPDWQPFGQGRFARGGEDGEAVILPDDAYRILILTKALANIASTSAAAINQLLRNLFPGRGKAYVEDLGGMAMRFVFDFPLTPVEYAIVSQSGALPHPAGVSLSVSVPP